MAGSYRDYIPHGCSVVYVYGLALESASGHANGFGYLNENLLLQRPFSSLCRAAGLLE